MIVFVNGSFGVGKTAASRILRKRLRGSVVFNPEWTGSFLMRLPLRFKGSGTDDFQDIELWRRSVIAGIRLVRTFRKGTIIVPMTFSCEDYLNEVLVGVKQFENDVRVFCLQADLPTILERLGRRGEPVHEGDRNWSVRKAKICVEVLKNKVFGEAIETRNLTTDAVAVQILQRLTAR